MEFDDSILIKRTDNKKQTTGAERRRRMTFHCQQCNTILADSFGVCGEIKCMDSIMCIRVTNDVVVSDAMESGHKGEMADCIYSSLKCRVCSCAVGKVIHSSPSRLAVIRSIFLLYKANISCYVLDSSSMVKASTLSFDVKPLRGRIDKVKQHFKAQLERMSNFRSGISDSSVTSQLDK